MPGLAEGHEARPGAERDRLLQRLVNARVPHLQLSLLVLEVEGPAAFTDDALRRMVKVLDVIEAPADGANCERQ